MSYRKEIITTGQEASGKTAWAQAYATRYPGLVVVYNRSNPDDFKACITLRMLSSIETAERMGKKERKAYMRNPRALWLETEDGRLLPFPAISRLKGFVEIQPISDSRDQDMLFFGFSDWLCNALLILDDTRAIFRGGVSRGIGNLFLKKRWAGSKLPKAAGRGVDIIIITHGINLVNPEIWASATDFVLFPTTRTPNVSHLKDYDLEQAILTAHKKVCAAPLYHWAQVPLRGKNAYSVTIQKPVPYEY